MLPQPHKTSPITTDQSWYTPNKHKNVSAIETNPSMNVVNSHQYSSIELSESLAQSPSFLSPNKELGSFLMTPNYSSKQMMPSGSESIGDMRLRTESLIETSRFHELTGESKKTESGTSSHEAKELIKMINEIRQIKAKKTYHSRKLNEQMAIQSFLVKEISQKEQSILAHKLKVQEKIQQKNKLQKKLKQKRVRIKAKTKNFLHQLQAKVNKLRQQLDTTCHLLNLDQMTIGRYQQELYQINNYMQQQGYSTNPPYYTNQNQGDNYVLQSKAEQLNYQQIPGFYSNPSSSRSHQTNMKKSSQGIQKSGQQKSANSSNLSIQDLLKNHLSSMMSNGQVNQEKLRKFSFGQNPSFCMDGIEKRGSGKVSQQNENSNVFENNGNFIMQALAMRVNQLAGNNPHQNPQKISPQKRFHQNPSPFITQQFDNISPIASARKVRFANNIPQLQVKQVLSKNHNLSSNKKDFNQIIEQLDDKQSQCQVQYYNQSVIDINEDPMVESKYKNSPRLNFNRKQSQSPQHNRSPSGQTGKRSIKLPLVLEQSIVQIACQSSTCSDNLQRHQFSPRKQQPIIRRLRSPTHQVMPAIHEEMHHDLRKTDNRLKGSNKEGQSSKHSGGGAETPIFRSQASGEQQNLGFSRPFLGGSMKESQILDQQVHQFETNKSIDKIKQPCQRPLYQQQQQQIAYRTTVLTQIKKSQPYSIYRTHNMRTIQTDQQQPIEEKNQQSDDDFYSCTLKTESKVFVEGTVKSGEVNQVKMDQKEEEIMVQSKKSRYNNGQRKEIEKGKEMMNLVLENVKNKNYDMSLNLSELGHRDYDNQKRVSLDLNKRGVSVELDRYDNYLSDDGSLEKNQTQFSQRANIQSISTL